MTDLFNLRKYEADGHAINLYSTMLFFSTILNPLKSSLEIDVCAEPSCGEQIALYRMEW